MHRRTWLSLAGAAGTLPLSSGEARGQAPAAWTFDLDARLRWSLGRRGSAAAIRGAVIAVDVDGERHLLGALEDLHRFRTGTAESSAWIAAGRVGDVEITAEFRDGTTPVVTVRVRGLGAPHTVGRIELFDATPAVVPALAGGTAWINGYQSWSACRVAPIDAALDATGHWQLALQSAARATGLALSFGAHDTGAGTFRLTGRRCVASSSCDGRPVSAALTPATCTLTVVPDADPLAALGRLVAWDGPALPSVVPAGWCSWYELFNRVTEEDVLASLETARRRFDPRAFRIIQVDDGFQRACGDWETNARFPSGHAALVEHIHRAGFQAGLWLAPFAVADRSGIPVGHPDWLLAGPDGAPLVLDDRADWGGRIFGLDAEVPAARDWLRLLTRYAHATWGYDYLKLDFLYYGAAGPRPGRRWSGAEAYRAGLRALRDGAAGAYVLGCGAPLQHALGLVDGMRIGPDVEASVAGVAPAAQATLLRAHWHGRAWHNDPDALVVRPPLAGPEAQLWATVVALSGGVVMASDRLDRLDAARLDILARCMPALAVRGRPVDGGATPDVPAPALLAGRRPVVTLPHQWRFKPGDDPVWAEPQFDDTGWGTMRVGEPWEALHPGLDGFGWYRVAFTAPRAAPAAALALVLGKVDDADETYLNGVRLGGTGAFPPDYESRWQAFRRYAVPRSAVRWGRRNVVAVRAYDGGGPGGLWSLTRDLPPPWMLARVDDDRWMVAACNWDDQPHRMRTRLHTLGLRGSFATYDTWALARGPDLTDAVALEVPARASVCLGLRRRRPVPFVLGTTRHVVQGSFDVVDERWDARGRTLHGRMANLDGRPLAVTLAVPPGMRAQACTGSVPCRLDAPARAAWARLLAEPAGDSFAFAVRF